MQPSSLLAALIAFVAFAVPVPASAGPANWVRDSSGNAYVGEVDRKDAPFCPAKVIAFDLEQTGTADMFDGVRLDNGPTVYECVYVSKRVGMRLWFQFYRPVSGLPTTASKMIEGPDHLFARDGFTDFDVYRRADLEPTDEIDGPAVVTEPTTSLVFHSDQTATVDEYGHFIITGDEQ